MHLCHPCCGGEPNLLPAQAAVHVCLCGLVCLIMTNCLNCIDADAVGNVACSAGGVFTGLAVPFAYVCMMLVLWYGAVLVLQGAMTLGDLNAFMLYAIYVAGSAGGLAGTAAQVIAAVSATTAFRKLLPLFWAGHGCKVLYATVTTGTCSLHLA